MNLLTNLRVEGHACKVSVIELALRWGLHIPKVQGSKFDPINKYFYHIRVFLTFSKETSEQFFEMSRFRFLTHTVSQQ
jgi:hypothetical protein